MRIGGKMHYSQSITSLNDFFIHFYLNTKQVYLFFCEIPDQLFFYNIDGCFL
jgi:hypothetical protein